MQIPLHIFEERYKRMINECLASSSPFGIVFFSGDKIEDAGCAARVVAVTKRYGDGRMDISVRGTERFRMTRLHDRKPYLEAEVIYFDDEPVAHPSEAAKLTGMAVNLLQELQALLAGAAGEPLHLDSDPKSVSFRLAACEGFSPTERQALLELRSTPARLEKGTRALAGVIERLKISAEIDRIIRGNGKMGGSRPAS
jgi:Lon protease-like protein